MASEAAYLSPMRTQGRTGTILVNHLASDPRMSRIIVCSVILSAFVFGLGHFMTSLSSLGT
ncbi:hypothetical protein GGQ85_000171 [Nitrobacter vulgaris]|nr:hypothetical protein [Nitrobacter vulgaris]